MATANSVAYTDRTDKDLSRGCWFRADLIEDREGAS